jgi:hypothetical protein
MVREGFVGLDVVPVTIDVAAHEIRFSYPGSEGGAFAVAPFNGYVLTFLTDCVLIAGAAVIAEETTLPITDADLEVRPQSLAINVSGHIYGPDDTITVAVDVLDCPLS